MLVMIWFIGLVRMDDSEMTKIPTTTSIDTFNSMKGIGEIEVTNISMEEMKFRF